ncbi:hypothetical protein GE09DRAFT_420997 [Coniochaeta sp. 2T2.1]|nr:hypothetical protein GE09DRAFT_420997 [Coniochaeta sp. 2T2.1]
MGRKTAPQPLALGSTDAPGEDPPTSPGETYSHQSSPPISSSSPQPTSPRSPRSPFGFAQKKVQQQQGTGERKPLHVADLLQQPQHPLDAAQYLPLSSALHQQPQSPPLERTSDQLSPQRQQYHRQDSAEDQQQVQQQPYIREQQVQQPRVQEQQQQQFSPSSSFQTQQYAPRHHRNNEEKASKSGFFFNFAKSSKSSDRVATDQYSEPRSDPTSRDTDQSSISTRQSTRQTESSYPETAAQRQQQPPLPSRSDHSVTSTAEYDHSSKRGKPKPFALLGRSRSTKKEDRDTGSPSPGESTQSAQPTPVKSEQERGYAEKNYTAQPSAPLRTAPLQAHDRSFRDMMSSAVRNHSAERAPARDISSHRGREHMERESHFRTHAASFQENGSGSGFFSGLKNSGTKAAGMIGKGLFGKSGRSGSTTEREPIIDDEHYVLKVINLRLVEQTRRTRICKRLEDSRDKTEFWMPAFPWRAIDYLNFKGSDVEGLYRVPGSGPQIKKWQRKFDEELDVDLFEQKDLYDINIIGSMLKAWLRELPDELFPKAAQEKIARECQGSETVPQLLIDELSNLSPFNYYLLFAITCHLSLLLAHADKNKMDFRNLCICFQPCMKIDVFCFKFLVCDWRDCWKGCKNEAKYIEEEYALFDQPPPRVSPGESRKTTPTEELNEERQLSSSDSSKPSTQSADNQKARLRKKVPAADNASAETQSTISTNLTVMSERETPPRRSETGELRPLSPIKPLSPMGF